MSLLPVQWKKEKNCCHWLTNDVYNAINCLKSSSRMNKEHELNNIHSINEVE